MKRLLVLLLLASLSGCGCLFGTDSTLRGNISLALSGGTVVGHPGKEGLEVDGATNLVIRRRHFIGGSACCLLQDCTNVLVEDCTFEGMDGPADPKGQGLQLVRTTGIVRRCKFIASSNAEDLLSIYSDKPIPGTVSVEDCTFTGRGQSDSGNAICMDGGYPPSTTVARCSVSGARCGITISSGGGHRLRLCTFSGNGVDIYIADLYTTKPFGPFTVASCKVNVPILFGPGAEWLTLVK